MNAQNLGPINEKNVTLQQNISYILFRLDVDQSRINFKNMEVV